jgi:23S rRNA (guanosine2251-2'-O)-methyltransferase
MNARGGSRGGRTNRGTRGGGAARNDRGGRPPREEGLGGDQVEGRNAVRELLDVGVRRVRDVWISEDVDDAAVLDEIAQLAREQNVPVRSVTGEQLRSGARTDAPQGVIAHADPVAEADVDELLADPHAFLVALDGVTDPGNFGAVLRTACASGATGVIIPKSRSVRLTPAAVKAAAGAVEHLPIALVAGIPQMLDRAKRAGVWSVGFDADGDTSVFKLTVADQPVVLVMGAEGRGIARLVRDRCDVVAHIPMAGSMESLNVSAAAAVACFEVMRRRTES